MIPASTQPATTQPEHIPPVRRFKRQSLLLRSNQRPLADATPQPPCLPAGVRCGRGRGFGARSCAPGGERFAGVIGGPHHDAGVLLVVRGQSKWRPGREDQRAGRGERRSWRDELRAGCRGGGTRTRGAQAVASGGQGERRAGGGTSSRRSEGTSDGREAGRGDEWHAGGGTGSGRSGSGGRAAGGRRNELRAAGGRRNGQRAERVKGTSGG